ncbi:MAG TPA: hypothetical protein VFL29_14135 [Candidatus Dormibacteraeota bacterium]|nr:hypothetical protein [Candidatus Dormibacteraeota bacterium]
MTEDSTHDLEQQVRSLSGTVDELRARLARLETTTGLDAPAEPSRGSRRNFLRLGVAAAASAFGWLAVKAVPAAAATGGYMVLGCANTAANPTTLQPSVAAAPAFAAEDTAFSPSALSTALTATGDAFTAPLQGLGGSGAAEGVDGWASGASAYAVFGFTDAGVGVTGESSTGIGLYARASGRIRQDPLAAAGLPGYSPNTMEQVRDLKGVLWIHNDVGAWRRVNTLRTDAANGSGTAFKPIRIVDTRSGKGGVTGPVANTQVKTFDVIALSAGAIPADAIAVVGNITAVGWNLNGFLTVFPAGVSYNPNTDPSTMNFSGSAYAWANSFVVGLGTGGNAGKVSVYVGTFGSGSSNFIIDITAYVQ